MAVWLRQVERLLQQLRCKQIKIALVLCAAVSLIYYQPKCQDSLVSSLPTLRTIVGRIALLCARGQFQQSVFLELDWRTF